MPHNSQTHPREMLRGIYDLAQKVETAFFANADNRNTELPPPHWYAGKEVCLFLQHGNGVPNPGEIMTYGDYLQGTAIGTKKLFDDLLAANLEFVD